MFANRFIVILIIALMGWMVGFANALVVIDRPIEVDSTGEVIVPPGQSLSPLSVKSHHITVTITDQVAVTQIDQVFHNPTRQRLEGYYLFPIPRGAQVDRFAMDVNGVMTEAEMLDADKARQIYMDIVRKAQDPALLEYVGQGMIKARIFPIEPGSDKRVTLKYTEVLKSDGGMVSYRFPLNTEKYSATPIGSASVKIEVKSKRPIQNLYSPTHTVEIKRHSPNHAVIGWEGRDIRSATDFQLFYSPESAEKLVSVDLLTYGDPAVEAGGHFLLMLSPGQLRKDREVVAKDVVFVLDTSGSMNGEKIKQARAALQFCLNSLNEVDRFEVVRFSTEAEPIFGELSPATDANRKQALETVAGYKAMGGTAIHDALTKTLTMIQAAPMDKPRPQMVIFLTDGRPTIGTTDIAAINAAVQEKAKKVRVFCFGIGTDVNVQLLDRIASETQAANAYVLPTEDIEVKVSSFYKKLANPVLSELKLSLDSDRIKLTQIHPGTLPDLFEGEQLVIFGRYSGTGESAIRLSGLVNGDRHEIVSEVTFAKKAVEHDFIPRLWATRRIGFLLEQIRLNGEKAELKDEIVTLARNYNVVTPYTSYLIIEDEAAREVPVVRRTIRPGVGIDGRAARAMDMPDSVVADAEKSAGGGGGSGGAPAESVEKLELERLASTWRSSVSGEVGDAAVFNSRVNARLKEASSLEAQAEADGTAQLGYDDDTKYRRLVDEGKMAEANFYMVSGQRVAQDRAQQVARWVNQRAFYNDGSRWIDAQVQQAAPEMKREVVQFASARYFEILEKNPEASQYMSLGRQVEFQLADRIVAVVDEVKN